MEDPTDVTSVFSAQQLAGADLIPEHDFEYVRNVHQGGKNRLKHLEELRVKVAMGNFFMQDSFLKECNQAIEKMREIKVENSIKDLFCKYLVIGDHTGMQCYLCEKNTAFKNIRGLSHHIERSHVLHIVDVYNKRKEELEFKFTQYRTALNKVNFKSSASKTLTYDTIKKILDEAGDQVRDSPSTLNTPPCSPVPSCSSFNDYAKDVHLEMTGESEDSPMFSPLSVNSETRVGMMNDLVTNILSNQIDSSVCPSQGSEAMTTDKMTEGFVHKKSTRDLENTFELFTINEDDLSKHQVSESSYNHRDDLKTNTYLNTSGEVSVEPLSVSTAEISSCTSPTMNLPCDLTSETSDFEMTDDTLPVPAPQPPPAPLSSKKNAPLKKRLIAVKVPKKRPRSTSPVGLTKKHDGVAKRKVIETDDEKELSEKKAPKRKVLEKDDEKELCEKKAKKQSSDPSFTNYPTKMRAVGKKQIVPRKQVLLKKPKATAKNSVGVVVPKTSQTRSTRTRDEQNSVWANELVQSVEKQSAEERQRIAEDVQLQRLHEHVLMSINVPPDMRKRVKAQVSECFKSYEALNCNEKVSLNSRRNLGSLAHAKIISEYFGKKTNKNNNPYSEAELKRQIDAFVRYYSDGTKTSTNAKKQMENDINEKCKETKQIKAWKTKLNEFKDVSSVKQMHKTIDKVMKHCGKIPVACKVMTALKNNLTYSHSEQKGLRYEIKGKSKSKGDVRCVKNLVLQLGKGNLSNLKTVLSGEDVQAYSDWFKNYRKAKESISITNNVKWFLSCVESVILGGNTPMNPMTRISRTEVERVVKTIVEMICPNLDDVELFTSSFYMNLTIFCMKYIYEIYSEILHIYRMYQAKCQQPNGIHVGVFHYYNACENELNKFKTEIIDQYNIFMKNQPNKKSSGLSSNLFGINRLVLCLFQMKFIASGIKINKKEDLKDIVNTDCLKIIDLIESKCSIKVMQNIKSMIFEVIYNIVNNVVHGFESDTTRFSKKISWSMYSNVLCKFNYFMYPKVAQKVMRSFSPISLTASELEYVGDDIILDMDPRAWYVIFDEQKVKLFNELYGDYVNSVPSDTSLEEELMGLEAKRCGTADDSSTSESDDDDDSDDSDSNGKTSDREDKNQSSSDDDDDDDESNCEDSD